MPVFPAKKKPTPEDCKCHPEMEVEFMIDFLASKYGQCKKHIERTYYEYDFWEAFYFSSLESASMAWASED